MIHHRPRSGRLPTCCATSPSSGHRRLGSWPMAATPISDNGYGYMPTVGPVACHVSNRIENPDAEYADHGEVAEMHREYAASTYCK